MASGIVMRRLNLSLPGEGDLQQGGGLSTAQRMNPNALASDFGGAQLPGVTIAPQLHLAGAFQPVPILLALVGAFVAFKYVLERDSTIRDDQGGIRIGMENGIKFFFLWVIVATVSKWMFGFFRIPGLSALVLAA